MSLLLGIALGRKPVSHIDEALLNWFPEDSERRCHQRLGQVSEEVVRMFDADREPDRCITDANAGTQLGRYARMCCAARMASQRLCSSQADGKLEDLHPIEARERLR